MQKCLRAKFLLVQKCLRAKVTLRAEVSSCSLILEQFYPLMQKYLRSIFCPRAILYGRASLTIPRQDSWYARFEYEESKFW